jgi:DNA-binding GntR family transcriptional regulator
MYTVDSVHRQLRDPRGARSGEALGRTHRPLRAEVLDELRARIIAGVYPQGARLLEEEVAAELAVSRNPVREALQALAGEGFVEIEPRRGARVSTLTARRTDDLFAVRRSLEGLVAALAAERRTPAQLEELTEIVARGVAGSATGALDELPALNTRFHGVLAEMADNQLLSDVLERLTHVIQWIYTSGIAARSQGSWTEHERILAAIARGDASAAETEAKHHISRAHEAFVSAAAAAAGT